MRSRYLEPVRIRLPDGSPQDVVRLQVAIIAPQGRRSVVYERTPLVKALVSVPNPHGAGEMARLCEYSTDHDLRGLWFRDCTASQGQAAWKRCSIATADFGQAEHVCAQGFATLESFAAHMERHLERHGLVPSKVDGEPDGMAPEYVQFTEKQLARKEYVREYKQKKILESYTDDGQSAIAERKALRAAKAPQGWDGMSISRPKMQRDGDSTKLQEPFVAAPPSGAPYYNMVVRLRKHRKRGKVVFLRGVVGERGLEAYNRLHAVWDTAINTGGIDMVSEAKIRSVARDYMRRVFAGTAPV